jgi:integrase
MAAYAGGLRISEVTRLKVSDIHSQRMVLRVEQGKGQVDRYVMLLPRLLEILRTYWQAGQPQHWLFPGGFLTSPSTLLRSGWRVDIRAEHPHCVKTRWKSTKGRNIRYLPLHPGPADASTLVRRRTVTAARPPHHCSSP